MKLALPPLACSAVVVALTLQLLPVVLTPGLALLFLATLYAAVGRQYRQCLGAGMLVAVATLLDATTWVESLLPAHCERQLVELRGRVRGLPLRGPGLHGPVVRLEVEVQALSPAACRGPRHLRLYLAGEASVAPGDLISAEVRLRRPWSMENPAGHSRLQRQYVDGIHGTGGAPADRWRVRAHAPDLRGRLSRFRDRLSSELRRGRDAESGALLAALAVGDQRFISAVARERLQRFGLSHLMVVSGMHISLLAGLGWGIGLSVRRLLWRFRPAARIRAMPHLSALSLALAYSVLSGFAVPAQRAMLMLTLALGLAALGHRLRTRDLVSAAVLLLLIHRPAHVLDASFWLSIGAVSLLLGAAAGRRGSRLSLFLQLQLFMALAMLPLSLFWFSRGSAIGALANLPAIPLISMLVTPLAVGGALLQPVVPSAAALCWNLAELLLGPAWALLTALEARFEPPFVGTGSHILMLLPGLLAAGLVALPRFSRRAVCAVLLALPMLCWREPGPGEALRVTFFDVGQGTAVLLEHAGEVLLYDTAAANPATGYTVADHTVIPYLRSRGYQALDYLVVSHDDLDHSGGSARLRQLFRPRHERIQAGGSGASSACRAGRRERLGAAVMLRYLSFALPGDSDNNSSCVLLISAYGRRLLLPGDIDSEREHELVAYWGRALRADVLLAAHHGSASSSSPLFLRTVRPGWVVASAGRANRFGHPAPGVRQRVRAGGALLLNTAADGAIVFRVDPDGQLHCRRYRHRWRPFWQKGRAPRRCDEPSAGLRGV